jgi:hypothetical protein
MRLGANVAARVTIGNDTSDTGNRAVVELLVSCAIRIDEEQRERVVDPPCTTSGTTGVGRDWLLV